MRGGERPRWFRYLCPALQYAHLLTSDYQDPLPTVPVMTEQFVWSARMLSRRYVLVPDVSGRFR